MPQAQENSEFFQMVGAVIVNALIRQKTEEALVEERNFAKQIMGTMGQGLVTTTIEASLNTQIQPMPKCSAASLKRLLAKIY
ncbi:MAG: hypothetical protein H6656_01795 [Ardenticatenaceae bacterium]|nr:hypothetical protein [Ardenticatenaceae bacterium]